MVIVRPALRIDAVVLVFDEFHFTCTEVSPYGAGLGAIGAVAFRPTFRKAGQLDTRAAAVAGCDKGHGTVTSFFELPRTMSSLLLDNIVEAQKWPRC
jgi:hypothetical protein